MNMSIVVFQKLNVYFMNTVIYNEGAEGEVIYLMTEDFTSRLKSLRKEKGITQEMLAKHLDLPDSTLRRYETEGNIPKRERLELIADYFGVSIDYLMGRTDDKTKKLSEGARELYNAIDLSEDDAIKKIMETFSYKGNPITEDQARTIYFVSLGALKKD